VKVSGVCETAEKPEKFDRVLETTPNDPANKTELLQTPETFTMPRGRMAKIRKQYNKNVASGILSAKSKGGYGVRGLQTKRSNKEAVDELKGRIARTIVHKGLDYIVIYKWEEGELEIEHIGCATDGRSDVGKRLTDEVLIKEVIHRFIVTLSVENARSHL